MKALVKRREGRPTKYNAELIIPKIDEYLQTTGKEQQTLPTIEGLALYLNVNPDTLVEWSHKYPEFSASIKKVNALQKNQLMNDGTYGGREVNAGMAVFLLKANHGMKENDPSTMNQTNVLIIPSELTKKYGIKVDNKMIKERVE